MDGKAPASVPLTGDFPWADSYYFQIFAEA